MALQAILSSCLDLHSASAAVLDQTSETHLTELGRCVLGGACAAARLPAAPAERLRTALPRLSAAPRPAPRPALCAGT
jgi:hypothetical protein